MHAAIHAWFDPGLDRAVRKLQSEVHGRRVRCFRPHITLSACSDLSLEQFVEAIGVSVAKRQPFAVTFDSYGCFPAPVSSLFLSPVPTDRLLRLHRAVAQVLDDLGKTPVNPHYLPDQWTPHCALANKLTENRFEQAAARLLSLPRPVKGHITRIGIVELPEDREVMALFLGEARRSEQD